MTNVHLDTNKQQIRKLIEDRKWKDLASLVEDWPDPEVADLLLELESGERLFFYRSLPRTRAASVFAHLEVEHQDAFVKELSDEDNRHLLAHLNPDDRTALLEELPAGVTQRLMQLLSPDDLREARELLGYPVESIGRLMTPDYIAVRKDMTIAEALQHARETGKDKETFNVIYVTDENGKLLDSLRLRRFIMASPDDIVESIMDHKYVSLSAFEDRERAVDMFQRYDIYALPVVDSEGALLGIVTLDDVIDVAEEEATEDFHKGAAVAPLDAPYNLVGVRTLFAKRIPWLLILVVVGLASSFVISRYEEVLEAIVILAFFIPLLIDSGGNTGAQSATLMVRAISTREVTLGQWWAVLRKELMVGLTLGLAMGAACFAMGVAMGWMLDIGDLVWAIGTVVGLSMICIILMANLLGTILPFVLTRVGVDPAVASSPLVTTICDVFGLVIYFSIAAVVLSEHLSVLAA